MHLLDSGANVGGAARRAREGLEGWCRNIDEAEKAAAVGTTRRNGAAGCGRSFDIRLRTRALGDSTGRMAVAWLVLAGFVHVMTQSLRRAPRLVASVPRPGALGPLGRPLELSKGDEVGEMGK